MADASPNLLSLTPVKFLWRTKQPSLMEHHFKISGFFGKCVQRFEECSMIWIQENDFRTDIRSVLLRLAT